jgi:hypothetical protein
LYIPEEAVHSLLELVAFNKLRRLFTHVTPDSFVVDAARRYSPLNMPVDFFAQSGFSRGAVNWVSTDGDSIDLRAYSESWTDEEKISVGLTNASLNTKKLMELIKYVKWIAMTLIVLTAVTLLKG